jgi:RimJ/RimL family protein N-acetyltransferase
MYLSLADRASVTAAANPLAYLDLPIETPRLILRLPSSADLSDLNRMFRHRLTARALGAPLHSTSEMREPALMVARTLREFRSGAHLSLSVLLQENHRCVGRVGLRGLDWTYHKVESLSFWIDPKFWNRGLATEASWFLCHAGFVQLGLRRISSQALDRNEASQTVLRKLGFRKEGRERQAICLRGRCMDMILFGLLPGELRPVGWTTGDR